jgi:leucyl aminopeptidase
MLTTLARKVLLVQLGKEKEFKTKTLREALRAAAKALLGANVVSAGVFLDGVKKRHWLTRIDRSFKAWLLVMYPMCYQVYKKATALWVKKTTSHPSCVQSSIHLLLPLS